MKRLPLRILAVTLALTPTGVWAASVPITNPGFESDFTGWTEVEPAAISTSDHHSGTKSGKMSSPTGQVKQTVSGLTANTTYVLKGWLLGNGKIGARSYGGADVSSTKNVTTFTQASVTFTTGASNTSVEIYAAWVAGGDARVDDFTLDTGTGTPTPTSTPTSTPTATATPTTPGGTPVLITPAGSAVTASTNDGNVPGNTVDNDLATRWSGNGDGAWIRYDLGSTKTVSYVTLGVHLGNTRKNKFDLQVSTDGASWTNVLTNVQTNGATTAQQTFDFTDASARYVRYLGHGSVTNTGTTGTWNSLLEVDIYGLGGTPTATPTGPTPTSTPTPTPTATPTPGGGTLPAQLLDLTNWKETLPIGSSGSPTEIKQPQLATYSIDPWFRVNAAGDGVQFRAHTSGVTTSGSSYPRSELREMASGGSTNASWSTTSGVHTMYIREAITAVPTTKKHVVAGQIHDANDDVIVIRLEYPKLFVDINGATGPTLDASYVLGRMFEVRFVASGGQIKIYYNGSTTPSHTLSKSTSGCYFKAGAYTQSNCSTESSCGTGNYGEVHIYDLWVTHQ